MGMESLELLSFKNISKDHFYTVKESLILGIICLLPALMEFSKLIGMKKDILELLPANSPLNIQRILLFILQMMLFKKMELIMVDSRKAISYLIRIFKNIYRQTTKVKRLIFLIIFSLK